MAITDKLKSHSHESGILKVQWEKSGTFFYKKNSLGWVRIVEGGAQKVSDNTNDFLETLVN